MSYGEVYRNVDGVSTIMAIGNATGGKEGYLVAALLVAGPITSWTHAGAVVYVSMTALTDPKNWWRLD